MKKQIISGIAIIACVALCATVQPWSTEVGNLSAEPEKVAVTADIGASQKEAPPIILSADPHTPEMEAVAESEQYKIDITTEEKTEPPLSAATVSKTAPTPSVTPKASTQSSSDPKPGTIAVIDGVKSMWIPGFGWVKDEGGGSVCIPVDGEGDINKQIGIMGGGTMVGNPGDELTGHKVGIMGGGTVAEDMYENGHKIGIMGGSESTPSNLTPPPADLPEPTGEVIYIELQPTPTKDSTPPPYKPGEVTPNP